MLASLRAFLTTEDIVIIRVPAAVIIVTCGLCACITANQDHVSRMSDTADTVSVDENTSLHINEAMITPTPEMLKAALTNNPDAMRDAMVNTATGCHGSTICPSQFASCTNWSTSSLCDANCITTKCSVGHDPGDTAPFREKDEFNSFRICFDSNQNACTEFSHTTTFICAC
jgi:hypothetical protein